MRYKGIKSTSSQEDRKILEQCLKNYKTLYNLSLEIRVSESSLYKYRNGWEQGKQVNDKITEALRRLSPPTLMPS